MNVDRAFPTSCLEGTSVAARESSKRRKLEVSKCKYAVLHLISSPPRHTHTHTHTPPFHSCQSPTTVQERMNRVRKEILCSTCFLNRLKPFSCWPHLRIHFQSYLHFLSLSGVPQYKPSCFSAFLVDSFEFSFLSASHSTL